jgi:hypothetical protein
MTPSITIDTSKMEAAMRLYRHRIGTDSRTLITTQAVRLSHDLINAFPPKDAGTGDARIAGDQGRAIRLAEEDDFKDPKVRKMVRERNLEAFRKFLDRANMGTAHRFSRVFLRNARSPISRRGKLVPVRSKRWTLDVEGWKANVTRLARSVGRLKAGWAMTATQYGSNITIKQHWVARHHGKPYGETQTNLSNPNDLTIAIRNHAPGVTSFAGILQWVVDNKRAAAIKRDMMTMLRKNKKFFSTDFDVS